MTVTTRIETISPAKAAEYLKLSTGNRKISKTKLSEYVRAMKAQKWRITTDSIGFNIDNELVAGHHRLLACGQAGVSFTTQVTRGLDRDVRSNIDTGASQDFNDFLQYKGRANSGLYAAALRLVIIDSKGAFQGTASGFGSLFTFEEGYEELETNAALQESMDYFCSQFYRKLKNIKVMSVGLAAFMFYKFSQQDSATAKDFFRALCGFEAIGPFDPVHLLRERLTANAMAKKKMSPRDLSAIFIKVWKCYRDDKAITVNGLRFRSRGEGAENFPSFE